MVTLLRSETMVLPGRNTVAIDWLRKSESVSEQP
ncbi:hypothetical protein BH20ACI3_BH20ACI3_42610 [soil metagenome]